MSTKYDLMVILEKLCEQGSSIEEIELLSDRCIRILKLIKERGTPEELFYIAKTLDWDFDVFKTMEYPLFLKTFYWKTIKNYRLFLSGYKCEICDAMDNLHVHHKSYQFRGKEINHIDTLQTLCSSCHSKQHPDKKSKAKK